MENQETIEEEEKSVDNERENISWNGETNTVLIYDKNISSENLQPNVEKIQDQVWKGKESFIQHLFAMILM